MFLDSSDIERILYIFLEPSTSTPEILSLSTQTLSALGVVENTELTVREVIPMPEEVETV